MQNKQEDLENISPYKLMGTFSNSKIVFCVLVAVLLHLVVIGGTSLDYIYYRLVFPELGVERDRVELEEQKRDAEVKALKARRKAEAQAKSQPAATGATIQPGASESEIMQQRKDSPVIKQITEKASSAEIPSVSDDLGITLEDMNPR